MERGVGLSGVLAIGSPRTGQIYLLEARNGFLTATSSLRVTLIGGRFAIRSFLIALPKIKLFAVTGAEWWKFLSWHVVGALHQSWAGKECR